MYVRWENLAKLAQMFQIAFHLKLNTYTVLCTY